MLSFDIFFLQFLVNSKDKVLSRLEAILKAVSQKLLGLTTPISWHLGKETASSYQIGLVLLSAGLYQAH
jgi:hypothetical protein